MKIPLMETADTDKLAQPDFFNTLDQIETLAAQPKTPDFWSIAARLPDRISKLEWTAVSSA